MKIDNRMLQIEPDLSQDLEWMLKSSQASDDLILSPLLDEYIEPVFQLLSALIGDPDEVCRALAETFADVLIDRHRFSDRLDVKIFVFRRAVQVYHRRKLLSRDNRSTSFTLPKETVAAPLPQDTLASRRGLWAAIGELPEQERLVLVLHAINGINIDQLSKILGEDKYHLQRCLDAANQDISRQREVEISTLEGERIDENTAALLSDRRYLPSLPQDCYNQVYPYARLLLGRKKRSQHIFIRTTQIMLGAFIVALMLAIGAITNQIAALESPSPLAVRTVLETQFVRITVIVTGTPVPNKAPDIASADKDAGFDPASSQLAFQWRQSQPAQSEGYQEVTVDILADGDLLGQMQISDPWSSSCERSPDGRFLAFVERPDVPPFPLSRMRLMVIPDLQSLVEPLPKGSRYGNDVAFSPDSRHLAFWGCNENRDCGVYLLNLHDQELVMLLPGRYTGYFMWSPDGEEIAMLRANGDFVVVDAGTGEIMYEHVMDWIDMVIPRDAPIISWGLAFPPMQSDLRGCEAPG